MRRGTLPELYKRSECTGGGAQNILIIAQEVRVHITSDPEIVKVHLTLGSSKGKVFFVSFSGSQWELDQRINPCQWPFVCLTLTPPLELALRTRRVQRSGVGYLGRGILRGSSNCHDTSQSVTPTVPVLWSGKPGYGNESARLKRVLNLLESDRFWFYP